MNAEHIFDLAIQIEQKVSQLYSRFSSVFRSNENASRFWSAIALHEKGHAEALMLGKGSLLGASLGLKEMGNPDTLNSEDLEGILKRLREYERQVKKEKPTLQEAVTMMLEIENGEIDKIYNGLVHWAGLQGTWKMTASQAARDHARMITEFLHRSPVHGQLAHDVATPVQPQEKRPLPGPPIDSRRKFAPKETEAKVAGKVDQPRRGTVADIVLCMSYGMISGEDGRQYLFTHEELGKDFPVAVRVNAAVTFRYKEFPWGPQAYQITFLT